MQALDWITTYIINLEVSCKDLQIFYDLFWNEKDFFTFIRVYFFVQHHIYRPGQSQSWYSGRSTFTVSHIFFESSSHPLSNYPLTTHTDPPNPHRTHPTLHFLRSTLYSMQAISFLKAHNAHYPLTQWPFTHLYTTTVWAHLTGDSVTFWVLFNI